MGCTMKVLYLIYQFVIFLPIMLVLTILATIITMIGCAVGNGDFWGYYPGKIWAKLFCIMSLCPVKVKGYENIDKNTSYVFVANHQGAYDIFLIYGYLNHNFKWMMKQSLSKIPFVGAACKSSGQIFVDDSGRSGIRQTIEQAENTLKEGMSMVIFPEGSRTLDGHIHRFKKGAFQLAYDVKLPIVPVTIEGPFKVMKRGTFLIHPHKLQMTIHKPIYMKFEKETEVDEIKTQAFNIIAASLGEKTSV